VIVKGHATKVSSQESDEYFALRPWGSRIGAWASEQSSDLESREVLQERYTELTLKYPEGSAVPRPPHWGGFIVAPVTIEFWQGRYSRLHDRIIFTQSNNGWSLRRLNP
jgi:pyridoxamine 5'-phosphate oxidase